MAPMRNESSLSEREELILQAVVHSFVSSAEPVGSRTIVKRFGLDISPATVRNVMSDLEEAGYLSQVHTSSGRVPTDQGYRYYVDYLMRVQDLTQAERAKLEREYMDKMSDAEDILRQTSQLLALLSKQTGIVEAPQSNQAEVQHIEVMLLGPKRVVVLLADTLGRVRTNVLNLAEQLSAEDGRQLTRFLNEHLVGVPVDEIGQRIQPILRERVDEEGRLAAQASQMLELVPVSLTGTIYTEGATQLFEQPEFRDVDKAREVLGLLEKGDRVFDLLRSGVLLRDPRTSRVLIGGDASTASLQDISVVSAPYRIGEKTVGMVGVLGPRRVPYSKLTGVVEYTANLLSRWLTRLSA